MNKRYSICNRIAPYVAVVVYAILVATPIISSAGVISRLDRSVGGIIVNADGVLNQPEIVHPVTLRRQVVEQLREAPDELNQAVQLRKVSLKRLQSAIEEVIRDGSDTLSHDVYFLAGLQRIRYILVYPEKNDIVLVGEGDGWTVDEQSNVVSSMSGLPVMRLDDLVVAFRSVFQARGESISCSIDPEEEGLIRLQNYVAQQKQYHPRVIPAIERALGPQKITITGISPSTHFARVLVAADHRMKRIAMGFDASPVKKLASFLDLVRSARSVKNMMPRWWLACDYEPLARSEDSLTWEIRGRGVKCLTEQAILSPSGVVEKSEKNNYSAEKWAEMMTLQYDRLCEKEVVFAQLRNLMDLCVVATLIQREGLLDKAQCDLSLLTAADSPLIVDKWHSPKTVSSQVSVVRKKRDYIITASGGVEIDSWSVVEKTTTDEALHAVREEAAKASGASTWWWN